MNYFFLQKTIKEKKGFTLVEMMVALSLFTIATLASISTLYTVNNASRRIQSLRSVMDNLNFAVESMSRTIRTSQEIFCGPQGTPVRNCPFEFQNPSSALSMNALIYGNQVIEYRRTEVNGVGFIERKVGSGPWSAITAPEINVQSLQFYVDGADSSDLKQPMVTFIIKGVATTSEATTPFSIQSIASQRSAE